MTAGASIRPCCSEADEGAGGGEDGKGGGRIGCWVDWHHGSHRKAQERGSCGG